MFYYSEYNTHTFVPLCFFCFSPSLSSFAYPVLLPLLPFRVLLGYIGVPSFSRQAHLFHSIRLCVRVLSLEALVRWIGGTVRRPNGRAREAAVSLSLSSSLAPASRRRLVRERVEVLKLEFSGKCASAEDGTG